MKYHLTWKNYLLTNYKAAQSIVNQFCWDKPFGCQAQSLSLSAGLQLKSRHLGTQLVSLAVCEEFICFTFTACAM